MKILKKLNKKLSEPCGVRRGSTFAIISLTILLCAWYICTNLTFGLSLNDTIKIGDTGVILMFMLATFKIMFFGILVGIEIESRYSSSLEEDAIDDTIKTPIQADS